MEILATSETLAEGFPQTAETRTEPLDSPPARFRREAKTRVSRLGFLSQSTSAKSRERSSCKGSDGREIELELSPNGKENRFVVGDFVWVKMKNHPWWPGKVQDPSQLPDHSIEAQQKDNCLLVSFFCSNSFALCELSQLKPFKEEFKMMAKQSGLKSFTSAVRNALDEISRSLESEMTCYCAPVESRVPAGKVSFTNYAPEDFLWQLRDAACDVSVTDMLEATMLRSWVSAFIHGKASAVRTIMDLVDEEGDLNAPAMDLIKESRSKEEQRVTGKKAVKGPEISEGLSLRKKKRSMAELIAVPDRGQGKEVVALDKSDRSASRKHKKRESSKGASGVEIGRVGAEEGAGSSRRKRKKSKYLSPPYTYLIGYSKRSDAAKDEELEMAKKELEFSSALLTGSPPLVRCIGEVSQSEEEKMSPSFRYAGTSASVILSQFLHAAIDPLHHLKWNRSAKAVRGFFAEFRNLVYCGDPDFEIYPKYLDGSASMDRKFLYRDMVDVPKEGKFVGKGNKLKDRADGEADLSLGHDTRKKGRKMKKDQATGGNLMNLGVDMADGLQSKSERPRKNSKDSSNGRTVVDLGHKLINCSEEGKSRQKRNKSIGLGNGGALCDSGDEINYCSLLGKLQQQQQKTSKEESEACLDHRFISGSEEGKSRQKRKKKGNVANPLPEPSPPLPYIRENLERMILTMTGCSLSEKDIVSAPGLKPEVRENLVSEMQCLLKKVNNLLTGVPNASC